MDLVPFDYETLEPDLVNELKAVAERIRLRLKKTAEDIIDIGKDLINVKEKLPHGQFTNWLQLEFDVNERTARNFMNVARVFEDKTETVSVLSPRALYELAAPSTLETVKQEVLNRLEKGEVLRAKEIQELKRQAKEAQERQSEAETRRIELEGEMHLAQSRINELNQRLAELKDQPPKVIEKEKIPEGYKTVNSAIKGLERKRNKLEKELSQSQEELRKVIATQETTRLLHNKTRQFKRVGQQLETLGSEIDDDKLLAFIRADEQGVKDELSALARRCEDLARLIRRKLEHPRANVIEIQAEMID